MKPTPGLVGRKREEGGKKKGRKEIIGETNFQVLKTQSGKCGKERGRGGKQKEGVHGGKWEAGRNNAQSNPVKSLGGQGDLKKKGG